MAQQLPTNAPQGASPVNAVESLAVEKSSTAVEKVTLFLSHLPGLSKFFFGYLDSFYVLETFSYT